MGILCLLMGAAMSAQQPVNNPTDPTDTGIKYWQKVEAVAKAKKAALDAQAAEFQASLGSVTGQTTITGTVTEGTEPAKPEALLLTVDAADKAAVIIAEQVGGQLNTTKQLLLITSTDDLSLAQLRFYDLQRLQIDRLMVDAAARLDEATKTAGTVKEGFVPPIAAAGALLDAASKIGSYFMTDYKFGKVDVTLPDRTILYAVAARLQPKLAKGGMIFIPQQLAGDAVDDLVKELADPSAHHQALELKADAARSSAGQKPAVAAALASADAAVKVWDTFVTALVAAPAQGEPAIERILRQKAIKRFVDAGQPALVLSHQIAGSYYTKKNLWTFLGGPPLYTAAAVAVSYALLDGADRHIRVSGTVPVHGGYGSVNNVMNRFRPKK
ncbi:MAG: hypothetical protein ACJ8FS_09590 [Sphingomicrobium sp.]